MTTTIRTAQDIYDRMSHDGDLRVDLSDILLDDFEAEDDDDTGFYQQGCEFLRREITIHDGRIAELTANLEKQMDDADAGLHREFLLEKKIAALTEAIEKHCTVGSSHAALMSALSLAGHGDGSALLPKPVVNDKLPVGSALLRGRGRDNAVAIQTITPVADAGKGSGEKGGKA